MTERERLISVHNYNIVHTDNINVEFVATCVYAHVRNIVRFEVERSSLVRGRLEGSPDLPRSRSSVVARNLIEQVVCL
jgi:hypothetical protein